MSPSTRRIAICVTPRSAIPCWGARSRIFSATPTRRFCRRTAGAAVIAIKREALASGQPKRAEVALEDGSGLRWNDLHIEPLHNEAGDIVGLTCASVDVTERKEGEAHLRLLMRELTHRSKNLLAVIQAMARQTARHAGSTERISRPILARDCRLWPPRMICWCARAGTGRPCASSSNRNWPPSAAATERRSPSTACRSRSSRKRRKISGSRCTNSRSTRRNSAPFRCRRDACRSPGRCAAMRSISSGASKTVRR